MFVYVIVLCLVFAVAEFFMEYPFVYVVTQCNYQLNSLKLQDLHEFVCRNYEINCPFYTIMSCLRRPENARSKSLDAAQVGTFAH